MAIPAIPTLGRPTYITAPADIIAYILRQFSAAPKDATGCWYDEVISLKDILSRYAYSKEKVCPPIQEALSKVYNRIFVGGLSTVEVTYEDVTVTDYNIIIKVTVRTSEGQYYTISKSVTIEDGRLVF